MEFINLKKQQDQILNSGMSLKELIEKNISKVLKHGKFILGPEVELLERNLAEYVGVSHCIACSSGTDALLIALMSLGIKENDEVITTPFSFFSTAEVLTTSKLEVASFAYFAAGGLAASFSHAVQFPLMWSRPRFKRNRSYMEEQVVS